MSKRGHCHHCMDECQGNRSVGHVNQNVSVQWADGECIACDEATHMASRIEELIAEYQQSTTGESSGLVGLEIALMILKRIDCQALIVLDGGLYKCDEMKEGHLGPHRSNRARAQWRTCGHWSATDE